MEILIGTALVGIVSLAAWHLMSRLFRDTSGQLVRQSAQADLNKLKDSIRTEFRARGVGATFTALPSTAFSAGGTPPCSGLSLTQPLKSGGTRTVTFETVCTGKALPAKTAKTHPDINCPTNTAAEVRVTHGPATSPSQSYPLTVDVLSMAVCFRWDASGVTAELGALARSDRGASHLFEPLFLPALSHAPRVQIYTK